MATPENNAPRAEKHTVLLAAESNDASKAEYRRQTVDAARGRGDILVVIGDKTHIDQVFDPAAGDRKLELPNSYWTPVGGRQRIEQIAGRYLSNAPEETRDAARRYIVNGAAKLVERSAVGSQKPTMNDLKNELLYKKNNDLKTLFKGTDSEADMENPQTLDALKKAAADAFIQYFEDAQPQTDAVNAFIDEAIARGSNVGGTLMIPWSGRTADGKDRPAEITTAVANSLLARAEKWNKSDGRLSIAIGNADQYYPMDALTKAADRSPEEGVQIHLETPSLRKLSTLQCEPFLDRQLKKVANLSAMDSSGQIQAVPDPTATMEEKKTLLDSVMAQVKRVTRMFKAERAVEAKTQAATPVKQPAAGPSKDATR